MATTMMFLFFSIKVSASMESEKMKDVSQTVLVYYDIMTGKETLLTVEELKNKFSIDLDAESLQIIAEPKMPTKDLSVKQLTTKEKDELAGAGNTAFPFIPFSLMPPYEAQNNTGDPEIRVPVANVNSYPYCSVAKIYGEGGAWRGTGFAVGKQLLATARHCIGKDDGNFHNTVTAYFGFNNNTGTYFYKTSDLVAYIYYPTTSSLLDDWIFLVWGSNTVQYTGCFGMDGAGKVGMKVSTAGYPQDQSLGGGNKMYECHGTIYSCDSWDFWCNLKSSGGQSGSPIYYNTSGGPYAIGILIGGYPPFNQVYSRRIDSGLVGWLIGAGYV